jgi:hypothetical protein
MRVIEIPGGNSLMLSNLEHKVYECMNEEVCKEDLSPRDAYIAQALVSRGALQKRVIEKKTYYKKSKGSL